MTILNIYLVGRLGKLGLKINGGRERPVVPGDPGIFITTVKRGSLLHKVIGPGDKILKVLAPAGTPNALFLSIIPDVSQDTQT